MAKRILVVDDEEIVTKTLQRLLKRQEYDVIIANNGHEALEEVKTQDFDLIICDMRMPGMDGIKTIKEIREYLSKSNKALVPEVVITGYADEEKYKESVDLKVADYVHKPFDCDMFLEIIRNHIK